MVVRVRKLTLNLFHGPYLVLQLIRCDVLGRFMGLFAICAIVACMNVACVFLLYNNDAYVGVMVSADV